MQESSRNGRMPSMQGLELCRAFFEEHGPGLLSSFPEIRDLVACGLMGEGSECFGFDDDLSQDHDFEPGFCIFLPGEDLVDRKAAFQLERAYAALPRSFRGFERLQLDPMGGSRHGVMRLHDFLLRHIGSPDCDLGLDRWLALPGFRLAQVCNGEVWHDPSGFLTRVREQLAQMPEDVRLKRLAGNLVLMDQSGLYNHPRCLEHGEPGAARLAMNRFVECALETCFLIERRYPPFYKWVFRACRQLPHLGSTTPDLEKLLEDDGDRLARDRVVEAVLDALGFSPTVTLTQAALDLNQRIGDGTVRNLDILAAVC